MICIQTFPSLQISKSPLVFSLPLQDLNFWVILMVGIIFFGNCFCPSCIGLCVHRDGLMATTLMFLFFFNKYGVVAIVSTLLV
jgi:hypothetical protein